MTINHLVISGGGISGFVSYGVLKELNKQNIWNIENIKSIYGSSAGSFIAIIIALNIDWDTLDDYFIKRPWNEAFSEIVLDIIDLISENGFNIKKMIKIILEPLFKFKNYDINITLIEFYNNTNIDLNFIATEINSERVLKQFSISHKNMPDMLLCDAIAASSSIPLIFKPIFYNNFCFIDGAVVNNYPLQLCIDEQNINDECLDTILGINNLRDTDIYDPTIINDNNIINYVSVLIKKLHNSINLCLNTPTIKNEIECNITDISTIEYSIEAINSSEFRENLIKEGEKYAIDFIKK